VSGPVDVAEEVMAAVAARRPVVALESTLVAHGLPRPGNLDVAREIEAAVRAEGAVPATIGVVGGRATVGLDDDALERLATRDVRKLGVRDLGPAAALGCDGATTVASTAHLAAFAGVVIFATGGLGGVHRGARDTWDESADLVALARTRIAVVCAGVKSILDVAATLERLETLAVPVVGYDTDRFPGFYVRDGGHDLDWSVGTAAEAAAVILAHHALGGRGLVVANPLHADAQLDPELHERSLAGALDALTAAGIAGQHATPFLLDHLHRATGGATVEVNVRLVLANARLAARIAVEMTRRRNAPGGGPARAPTAQ